MLRITIPETEKFDSEKNEFIYISEQKLQLEHSLVSISKWESKWCKPFLSKETMTREQTIDYIKCMTLTQNVDPEVYENLTTPIVRQINEYIDAPMTATWFSEDTKKTGGPSRETITNEIIYYWMITLNIPVEFQKWHLNRLLTLIKVCNAKNAPAKKMSRRELLSRNRALNEARRRAANSKG